MAESLKEVLMRRDDLPAHAVDDLIAYARQRVEEGDDPEGILEEEFGLEPDYVMDLL